MNVTLIETRVFANIIKLKISQDHPEIKSNDQHLYKRKAERDLGHRQKEEGHVKTEGEIEVMQPQAKEYLQPP